MGKIESKINKFLWKV